MVVLLYCRPRQHVLVLRIKDTPIPHIGLLILLLVDVAPLRGSHLGGNGTHGPRPQITRLCPLPYRSVYNCSSSLSALELFCEKWFTCWLIRTDLNRTTF